MLRIYVSSKKGGTGKSTTSINLAGAFTELGYKTAILDTDPQGTCLDWAALGKRKDITVYPYDNEFRTKLRVLSEAGTEICIFDGTPGVDKRHKNLLLCDYVLLVAKPSQHDLWQLRSAVRAVEATRNVSGDGYPLMGILLNMYKPWVTVHQIALASLNKLPVLKAKVSDLSLYMQVSSLGKTVFDSTKWLRGQDEFRTVAKEIRSALRKASNNTETANKE
jgi:chromosome partitioning protein